MATTTNNNSNQIQAVVLLKDASANFNASIANFHILIDSIINLPRGSNTAKELNCLLQNDSQLSQRSLFSHIPIAVSARRSTITKTTNAGAALNVPVTKVLVKRA
jgi:hypothetical protein